MPKIRRGDLARDTVTGYEGIVIARTIWLNGCVRYVLQAQKLNKDSVPHEGQTFDAHQLVLVKAARVEARPDPDEHGDLGTGGPMPAQHQHATPARR